MTNITLKYINHSVIKVIVEDSIAMEMREHFSYFADGYKFMPAYKRGSWDGQIRLLDYYKRTLPAGLYNEVLNFAEKFGYSVSTETNEYGTPGEINEFNAEELKDFLDSLVLTVNGEKIKPRDYQIEAFYKAIKNKRILEISPTGSGKSLIIYMLIRWIQKELPENMKFVLIVPRTQLVEQMYSDFADYSSADESWNVEDNCHKVYAGKDKTTDKDVIITTWQSIGSMPRGFGKSVYGMIGDEAHTFAAKVLTKIMGSFTEAGWRVGVTGTLKGTKVNALYLNGQFGPIEKIISSKELMDKGHLSKLDIDCLVLKYSKEFRDSIGKADYADEIKYIQSNESRTKFIANLAGHQKGNTLVAFRHIAHGKAIFAKIQELYPNRNVYYVAGSTKTVVREEIRKLIEKEDNAILVASTVFLTGVNIKNLHNIIFASPSKSLINVLQAIGRSLRKAENGQAARLFDIIDDMSTKSRKNFALLHGIERLKIYAKEKFNYKIHEIDFK